MYLADHNIVVSRLLPSLSSFYCDKISMGSIFSSDPKGPITLAPDSNVTPPWAAKLKPDNPVVYFDIGVDGDPLGY